MRPSFSLLPYHLCSVNCLRKNRNHLSEHQQSGDTSTPFASNLNPGTHLGFKYLMCAVLGGSAVLQNFLQQNRLMLCTQTPLSGKKVLLSAWRPTTASSSLMQEHPVQKKGLLVIRRKDSALLRIQRMHLFLPFHGVSLHQPVSICQLSQRTRFEQSHYLQAWFLIAMNWPCNLLKIWTKERQRCFATLENMYWKRSKAIEWEGAA